VLERVQQRLDRKPDAMTLRQRTVEHVFGTLKHRMGWTHFLTKTIAHVSTEMSLHVRAYGFSRFCPGLHPSSGVRHAGPIS